MAHLLLLGEQVLECGFFRFDLERDTFDDLEAGVAESAKFIGIVRHQAQAPGAQKLDYFRALMVFAFIDAESELQIRLDRIGPLILKRIGADLINDADAAPFLLLINYDAPSLLLHHLHRSFQLRPAIAFRGMKHVPGQTLRMNANQCGFFRFDFTLD
jgi:hypothetical protein